MRELYSVSSDVLSTRDRILAATLSLIQQGNAAPAMSAIAKAAGLSRQALYLIFADRADLFIAAVRYAPFDDGRGLAAELAKIDAAPTGVEAMQVMVGLQARLNPGLKPLADAARTAALAGPGRPAGLARPARQPLEWMSPHRRAHRRRRRPGGYGLDPAVAADMMWTLTSLAECGTTWWPSANGPRRPIASG